MFLLSSNQMNAFVSSYLCPGNWDFVVVFVALVFVSDSRYHNGTNWLS